MKLKNKSTIPSGFNLSVNLISNFKQCYSPRFTEAKVNFLQKATSVLETHNTRLMLRCTDWNIYLFQNVYCVLK